MDSLVAEESYKTLPAGVLDSSHATDCIILTGWVLDKPIDPSKVKAAWLKLITAWPLLVARLCYRSEKWEYHIPINPTIKNSFASMHLSAPIRDHYAYSTPTSSITVSPKENPLHLFNPQGPTSVAQLLDQKQDRPLVHLHVTTFEDGALVGISTPHILCDGHGVTSIVRCLCDIINGKEPPVPLDYTDPFEPYAQQVRNGTAEVDVPAPSHWRVLNKIERFWFIARSVWNGLWEDVIDNRDVYFPKHEVQRIKDEAMKDIRDEHGEHTDLWVSSSDAILAFLLQCVHPHTASSAPLNVFYTANLRPFLGSRFSAPFLRNTVLMPITPPLAVNTLSQMSLGKLALHIRKTLQEEMKEEARENWLRWRLKHADERDMKVFFDPWWGVWDVVTNWRKMGLMKADFSGAEYETTTTKKVQCVYVWGNGLQPIPIKNWIGLWTDDPSGGMWTSLFIERKVWNNPQGFGRFAKQ